MSGKIYKFKRIVVKSFFPFHFRYENLSDGLEDVISDTQTNIEDEEALDPIDDIWQEDNNNQNGNCIAKNHKNFSIRKKPFSRNICEYEKLNCDSDNKT